MLVESESPAQYAPPPGEQTNLPDVPLLSIETEVSLREVRSDRLQLRNDRALL